MVEHSRPLSSVAVAVLVVMTCATVINAAEFPAADDRVTRPWRAGPVENGGEIQRGEFSMGRYGVYFALAEHAAGARILSSMDFKGNITGRLLGLARAESFTVVEVDAAALLDQLDLERSIVASGPYADGRGAFVLAVGPAAPEVLVLLARDEFDWVIVDRQIIPDALVEEFGL